MNAARRPIALPSLIQRRLESAVAELTGSAAREADFTSPPGEPALTRPDSVSWQVFKNPVSLFIGGVAAVILELAEPRVRAGVWGHTTFRKAPLPRMQRTGLAAMMTVYGPRSKTEAMIARVRKMHAHVHGVTPDGIPYRADDPELLTWVHATAGYGFLHAYSTYVRSLSDVERNRFFAEGATSSRLYGATGAPGSERALDELLMSMEDKLQASPIIFEFLDIVGRLPLLPPPLAPVQRWLVEAAINILPPGVRERLELDDRWNLKHWQVVLIRRCGALLDRIPLRSAPPAQACRRLGLPETYLYMR
ncbi:oxygenase MpaB family protein [Noviherbaspirillum agri]